MIKNSFSLRVLIVSFLFIALPLLIYSFFFFQESYNTSITNAQRTLRIETSYRALTLRELQPIKEVFLRELIYIMGLSKGTLDQEDPEKLSRFLAEEVERGGGNFELYILQPDKNDLYKIIASSQTSTINTYFFSDTQLKSVIDKNANSFIRYIYSDAQKKYVPYLFSGHVIHSAETKVPIGIIMGTANIENQLQKLLAPFEQEQEIKFAILNSDGIVFAATDSKLVGEYFSPLTQNQKKQIETTKQIGGISLSDAPLPVIHSQNPPFFEFIFEDQVQIAYRQDVPRMNISVMSYSGKRAFFGAAVQHFLTIYSIYGLILIAGGGITYWLSIWISHPLRQLSQIMKQVSEGDRDARFKEEPLGFEINILGRMFNHTIEIFLENIQRAEDERVKKETYQRELAISRQVQRHLLPQKVPSLEGVELAGVYLPARDVGGDFYGHLTKTTQSGEEALVITVADTAGRGISSCLYSFSLRGLLRANATLSDHVGEILSLSNNAFIQDAGHTGMYVTLFYGMYHQDTKILNYYSCGHVPGLVKKANGEVVQLASSGIAIGLKESGAYPADSIQLSSGDIVILYTDGLVEAENTKGQLFSIEHLKYLASTHQWNTADSAVNFLISELQDFTEGVPQEEEVIIVVLKVN